MLKASLRCRILPRNAWRILLITAVLAMPLRHGFSVLAAAETKAAVSTPPGDKPKSKKKPKTEKKVTAPALIGEVEKGIAVIGKATKDGKIDPKSKAAAPFYASVGKVAKGVGALKTQLAAKDNAYFKTLSETAKAIGEMRVTAPRIGVVNKSLNDGTKIVFDSFDALNDHFGKNAARKKQGGNLTDKEKAAFAKLQAQQKETIAKLEPLRAKAKKAGNKKLAADLNGLIKQSRKIATAKPALDVFLTALTAYEYLSGQYDAYTYYLPADYRTEWVTVENGFTTYDTTYWEVYDSYAVSDWSYYETSEYSYSYDYTDVSMSSSEISEYYDSSVSEYSSVEVSDDTYVEEASYDESLSENEDEQDDSWQDDEAADEDDADDDDDDSDDDDDDSDDDDDDSDDDDDDSDDDDDDSDDDDDDSDDDDDDSGDDDDDSGDDDDDSGDDDGGDD